MNYRIGSILEPSTQAIGHQCNCISRGSAKGIAKIIFEKWPYANLYATRTKKAEPGTILCHRRRIINEDPESPIIFSLLGQVHPGRPAKFNDGRLDRLDFMRSCLAKLAVAMENLGLKQIEFPFGIGCGMAKGRWMEYLRVFEHWEKLTGKEVVFATLPNLQRFIEHPEDFNP